MTDSTGLFPGSWSLAVEEWFYILFPVITFLLLSMLGLRRVKLVIPFVALFFILLSFLLRCLYFEIGIDQMSEGYLRKTVVLRLDSISFGVIGAYIYRYHADFWKRVSKVTLMVGCICVLAGFSTFLFVRDYFYMPIISTYESFIILLFLPFFFLKRSCKNLFLRESVTIISLSSYSIYLIHMSLIRWQFLPIVNGLMIKFDLSENIRLLINYSLYIGLSIVISVLIYTFFELPILYWL